MNVPTISIGKHRGKVCFRWRQNGKPIYRRIKQPDDPKAVMQEQAALMAELMAGPKVKRKRLTLDQHLEDFAAVHKVGSRRDWSQQTVRRIRRILEVAKITTLEELTVAKVEIAIDCLRKLPRKPGKDGSDYPPLGDVSKNQHRQAIKQFARWLWLEDRTTKHLLLRLKLRKVRNQPNRRDRLMPEEVATLITHTASSPTVVEDYPGGLRAWLYRLASLTGYRRGELASLVPASFDLVRKTVTVQAAYTKNGQQAVQPLNSKLVEQLRPWLQDKAGPLFPGLAEKDTAKMIERDMAAAGIEQRTGEGKRVFHSLRNTFISSLLDSGLDLPAVQKLARHQDSRLTAGYARSLPGAAQSAVDALPCPALGGGAGTVGR
jgi:integrase